MALHLVIDGYNLIRQSPYLSSIELQEFQKGREALLKCLVRYQSLRDHRITVVFDGWKNGNCQETQDQVAGIRVVYSRLGEKADEVIKRIASEEGERAVVVTSDLDIVAFAYKKNAAVISPREFEGKIAEALCGGDKDFQEDTVPKTEKKGAPRRLSRIERRCRAKLKKL